jgi:hypothetical protein
MMNLVENDSLLTLQLTQIVITREVLLQSFLPQEQRRAFLANRFCRENNSKNPLRIIFPREQQREKFSQELHARNRHYCNNSTAVN